MAKIAIIGCGGMGRNHAQKLTDLLGEKIACASDTFPDARTRFAEKFPGTEMYPDHTDLLEKARPDAAWVCLPTFLHKQAVLDCASAGVHVMLEKPMALSGDECRAMDAAAREGGIKLMLAFCRRFDNHWGKLKELLTVKNVVGRPFVWRQTFAGGGQRSWFVEKDKGGGPFIDGLCHNYDFLLWALGKPVSVKSSLLTIGSGTALDTGMADLVFEGGDRTTVNWSWGIPGGSQAGAVNSQDVLGSTGVLNFNVPDAHKPSDFDPQKQGAFAVWRDKETVEVHTFEKNDMYADEDAHFLECIASGRDPSPGAADGLAATELAEQIFAAGV